MMEMGTVYLVGAGPGSQDLLTVRALRLIETADAVVYDRLVSDEILDLIPAGVARFDVGKRPGSHPVPQDSINSILIKLAHAQRTVVRLKGGDPMIFSIAGCSELFQIIEKDLVEMTGRGAFVGEALHPDAVAYKDVVECGVQRAEKDLAVFEILIGAYESSCIIKASICPLIVAGHHLKHGFHVFSFG